MIIREKHREYDLDITDNTCCVIASFSELAKALPFYIYCAGQICGLENLYAKNWYLKGYHLIATTEGQGDFTYRGKTYRLKKGDTILFDCTEFHEYHTVGGVWNYYYIRMDGASAQAYADHINGPDLFVYGSGIDRISGICEKCIDLCISADDNSLFEISNLLSELLTEIAMGRNRKISSKFTDPVSRAKDYIDAHFRENISLEALAEKVHTSKYHLCRQFREQTGVPPHSYISSARMSEARRLLITTKKTVSEIGETVGYGNANIFIRNFNKSEGCSPLTFRNRNSY